LCDDDDICTDEYCDVSDDCIVEVNDLCGDACVPTGKSRPKPPIELVFDYENTLGNAAFDEVCVTVAHKKNGILVNEHVVSSDFGTILVRSPRRKLNPEIDVAVCAYVSGSCTSMCAYFRIYTSCSQPLQVDQRFGSGEYDGTPAPPQDPAGANTVGELILLGQIQ